MKAALAKLLERRDLSADEARGAMRQIMSGEATPAQMGAYLAALRMKGETAEEIAGSARAMRERAESVDAGADTVLDVVGTGGDGLCTFNISTAAALVAAAAGVVVAKHGNRAVSSSCGSADVLEALGVAVTLSPPAVGQCLREIGIGFLFAPNFHPAMKHAIGPRREMGVRTIFNILGPLTNPAGANAYLMGCFSLDLNSVMARALADLGVHRAFVVTGPAGLDEIGLGGSTRVTEVREGQVVSCDLLPGDLGLPEAPPEALRGAGPAENAAIIREVFAGVCGPRRDSVLANAAFALVAAGLCEDPCVGVAMAGDIVDSGRAAKKLEQWVAFTQERRG